MASRRKARIIAFQAIYDWEASTSSLDDLLTFSWLSEDSTAANDEELKAFARLIILGTIENIKQVDAEITKHLENRSFDRIIKVDLAILRVSVYSLLYQKDIPARITIDEGIEIAKEYGSDDSFRFINGLLDAILKESDKSEN